jgi:hypothetical protein
MDAVSRKRATSFGTTASLAALLLVSRPAWAFNDGPDFSVPLEVSATRARSPQLALDGDDAPRRLVGLGVPSTGQFYGASAGLDVGGVPGRSPVGMYYSLLHVHLAWSGASSPVSETSGGAPVTVTRGTETLVEIGIPMIDGGVLVTADRFLLRFGLEGGWAYLSAKTTVQDAAGSTQRGSADAGSFYMHVPVAACLLAHPYAAKNNMLRDGEDVCLTLAPTVYEFGWFQGFSAGIRVDL